MTRDQMIDLAVRRCFTLNRAPLRAALLHPVSAWECAVRVSLLRRARVEFRRIADQQSYDPRQRLPARAPVMLEAGRDTHINA
jgi:hypothetical protein